FSAHQPAADYVPLSLHDALPIAARDRVVTVAVPIRNGAARVGDAPSLLLDARLPERARRPHLDAAARVGARRAGHAAPWRAEERDRKSTRLNSSHVKISYAVFCL